MRGGFKREDAGDSGARGAVVKLSRGEKKKGERIESNKSLKGDKSEKNKESRRRKRATTREKEK